MIQRVEMEIGGDKVLSLETGRLAREASGSVVVRLGDTMVLATVVASESPREGIDFFPLIVDFEEKLYAVGKIPGGFFKREGKPSEIAILMARKVDRPIRPLFPKGYRNDVQVVVTPLSVDQDYPHDILAITGASAALSISEIPFNGPVAAARVGKVDGKFVVDPTMAEMEKSDMDLVVAGTESAILMLECGSSEVSEEDVVEAIRIAHNKIKKLIQLQHELVKKAGRPKQQVVLYKTDESLQGYIRGKSFEKIKKTMYVSDVGRQMEEIGLIKEELTKEIKEKGNDELKKVVEEHPGEVQAIIEEIESEVMRKMILEEGKRIDGRGFKDIRELNCEVGILPRAHGSAVFTRGQTQVMTVATLGALGEEQRLEGLTTDESKRYMHHYNFPAYSVGEVKPMRGPGRREIGHGALAEKALVPVIPSEDEFPYTIRLVSEVLGSNGSTSMASTCGSTLALMDAGVKIKAPVAGISIGLVRDKKRDVLFTDIQGLEDHLGDMDFKVAGTRKGITAIQVDIKIDGLSYEIIEKALDQAREARLVILERMEKAMSSPRAELSPFAPRVTVLQIDPEKIGMVIGPGGKNIKRIIEETGADIDIQDSGRVLITSVDPVGAKTAREMIEDITFEPKVGEIYRGKVQRIMPFGAFVEIAPGKEGLVHISEIASRRIARVEDELSIGDEVVVKLMEIDNMGRYNFSRRAVTPEERDKLAKR